MPQWCDYEQAEFPDGQFKTTKGVRIHKPKIGTQHPADQKQGGTPDSTSSPSSGSARPFLSRRPARRDR